LLSGGPSRIDHPTVEVNATGEPLNIGQRGPDRSVQIVELYVCGHETIAFVEADGGTDEGTINIDYMGLQHENIFRDRGQGNGFGRVCGTKRRHRIGRVLLHMAVLIRRPVDRMRAVFVICHSPARTGDQPVRRRIEDIFL
jgi:hypothetical protein